MSLPQLQPAPTVANIDENFNLTVNWTPFEVNGGYSIYEGWNISLANPPGNTPVTVFTNGLGFGGTVSSPSFDETLGAGDYTINMVALSSDHTQYLDSNPWDSNRQFPPALNSTLISSSNPTLLLGQTLTITLSSNYNGTNVTGWQILYQDGTTSGFLPMSNRVVTKIFNTPGQQNIVVQTLSDFSNAAPPVKLTRSFAFSVFVVNQQYSAAPNNAITGTLGVGGEQGFEIVDNTSVLVTPSPFEVIVRSLVRDTLTNELKLLLATSRYSNASSLLGTMALDVFPFAGRPQAQQLIQPLTEVTATDSVASPVKIQTAALPSNTFVGKPMLDFKMSASGGQAPYSWFANGLPPGLKMSIDGTISGTPTQLGNFTVNFSVMDSSVPAFIAETTFTYTIPTDLVITTTSLPNATVLTPYSLQMVNTGGLFPFAWSVQGGKFPVGLTINQSTGLISGVPCTYSLEDFSGPFSVTLQVQDAVGALASQTYTLSLLPAALQLGIPDQPLIYAGQAFEMEVGVFGGQSPYTLNAFSDDGTFALNPANTYILEGGQFELSINVPNNVLGTHNFTVTVEDSASTIVSTKIYYTVAREVSNILVTQAAFDYDWGNGDTTSIAYPLAGQLGGFLLNFGNLYTVPANVFSQPIGLTVTVNPSSGIISTSPPLSPPLGGPAVEVAGPPTGFLNSEVRVPFILTNGASTVATISQPFTLLSHSGTTDIGTVASYTHPYIIGDFVALNPQRPYFNSADVPLAGGIFARLQSGSSLPLGLSLDQNAGLVYGTLLGTFGSLSGGSNTSVIEYVDSSSTVHGTVTIYWDTLANSFTLSSNLTSGTLQQPYSQTITSTSPSNLTLASVYRGRLPVGLALSVMGTTITLSGTPSEAGYFDLWIQATNAGGNAAYIYQRLAVTYTTPLTILTATLPACVETVAYSQALQGYGGVPPYTWTSNLATAFPGLAAYITLNSSTGVLSGTVPGASGLNGQSANILFTLTDSNSVVITRLISMTVNNALVITTTSIAPITLSQPYSFTMTAAGGIPPYTWTTTVGALPSGITIDGSGVISGTTSDGGYGTQSVTFQVTDSTFTSSTKPLPVTVGVVAGMVIDPSGVGNINRGSAYLGTLAVNGTYTTPVSWSVTSDSPNPLPSGLSLAASSGNNGATAIISGLYTGAAFTGYMVKIQAVDIAGHLATTVLSLTANSNLAITTTSPLPTAVVGTAYQPGGSPFQFTASGGGSPSGGAPSYTWSIPSPPLGFPFILSSGGVLSGTPGVSAMYTFTVSLSDGMSPADTVTGIFSITASTSTLAITTTSPLPAATAGVPYSISLAASGGTAPYTWALVGGSFPAGLSLASNGTISGTTNTPGNVNITIQVTDNVGSQVQKAFVLPVNIGLTLFAGIDYTNSLSLGILGYVTATGNVATVTGPNDAFFVVATGVIATSPSQLMVTVPSGFSSVVQSISGGVALIKLNGPFGAGSVGSNPFSITVTDVGGINASKSFTWTVYTSGALRLAPSSGSIPAYGIPLLEGTSAALPLYNDPSSPTFTFPTYNGQNVPPALAATTDFTLVGDTNAYQGLVSFGYTNPNFLLSYNAGALDSGVALNSMTITEDDIAWFSFPHSNFDLFASGPSLTVPVVYMVKPTVASVSPLNPTIPPSNTTPGNVTSGQPQTETEVPSSYVGWSSYGNLHSGGQDTITIFGNSNNNGQQLNMTNFGLSIPANATINSVIANITLNQSAGTSATYINGVELLAVSGQTPQSQIRQNGGNQFYLSPGSLTPAIANSTSFGVSLQPTCTQSPGNGAVLQLVSVTLTINYTVPNYNNILVNLSKPFSPYQQGTAGGTGDTITASATMTNGVAVISVTPNFGTGPLAGWLTGWTIQVQYPSGTGTVVSQLSMSVTGTLTYFNGSSLVNSGAITYISNASPIATITATYS